jgi:uncharacterized protein YdeI (YjbR/CyaY-like superfamily)
MSTPKFFSFAIDFRHWLSSHAASETELLVGFYKVGSGRPSMTWSESVDEALCFGWIDGVRRRIDEQGYSIRFTPRKTTSIWSAINISKFERLSLEGRMTAAGAEAFSHRKEAKSKVYAYERETEAELSGSELKLFRRQRAAWTYFETTPPSYKKVVLHWITTAVKTETRASRLAKLLDACANRERLRQG